MDGDLVGSYYEAVIRADWRGGSWRVTAGLVLACLLTTVLALWRARRIRFDGR